jgi:hypothetical protein
MSYPSFNDAQATVDEFLALLGHMGIDVASGSQSEADALSMLEVLEVWRGHKTPPADSRVAGVNYRFRWRLSFLPVFGPYQRSTIGRSDGSGVRSSV